MMNMRKINFIFIFYLSLLCFLLHLLTLGTKFAPSEFVTTALIIYSLFAFILWHSYLRMGWKNALIFLFLGIISIFLIHYLAVSSFILSFKSFDFKNFFQIFDQRFNYSLKLGISFLNVPISILFLWLSVIYISYEVSEHISNFKFPKKFIWSNRLLLSFFSALLGSLISIAWFISLDPLAVRLNWWRIILPGSYFWFLSMSFLPIFIFKLFFEKEKIKKENLFEFAPTIALFLLMMNNLLLALELKAPIFALFIFILLFPYILILILRYLKAKLNLPSEFEI